MTGEARYGEQALPVDLHVQRSLFDPVLGDFRWHREPRLEYSLHGASAIGRTRPATGASRR